MTDDEYEALRAQLAQSGAAIADSREVIAEASEMLDKAEAGLTSQAVRIVELEAAVIDLEGRLDAALTRAAHWQDISKNLERQVELLRQALS